MKDTAYCKDCKVMIVWVKTKRGRLMACDTPRIDFAPDPDALLDHGAVYVMSDDGSGEMIRGWICSQPDPGTVKAYRPHYHTCPKYKSEPKQAAPAANSKAAPASRKTAPASSQAKARQEPPPEYKQITGGVGAPSMVWENGKLRPKTTEELFAARISEIAGKPPKPLYPEKAFIESPEEQLSLFPAETDAERYARIRRAYA